MIKQPPSNKVNQYPRRKIGYSGELGQGSGVTIKFLQTAINHSELDNLDLIENIPGSDKWDVRDLFQRTVDKERVSKSILPYLQDENKVKFFNPLTLVLLPFDPQTTEVEHDLAFVKPRTEGEGEHQYEVFEKENFYQFYVHQNEPAYSYIEWNEQKIKVVAIDGQHRLSALKRWKNDPKKGHEFATWSIPVVILALFKEKEDSNPPTILEVVRKTFVYINSTAKEINESRKILLDDESVNCICCQEVVQHAHENDQKSIKELDIQRIPLMFFDWRGEVKNDRPNPGPAAIKSIEEIKDWFENYIIGYDGSPDQEASLNLEELIPPLTSFGKDKALSTDDSHKIREQFKKHLLPAFCYVMENFEPYKEYIKKCRLKQYDDEKDDDISKHAYQKICFGSYNVGSDLIESVENKYREIVNDFIGIKQETFHELIVRDVGMRSIWSAFGILKNIKDDLSQETEDWLSYSEWFTPLANEIYNEGWFKSWSDLKKKHSILLTHVVYDPSGGIINYRHNDVKDALGTFFALLIAKKSGDTKLQSSAWDELNVNFRKPLKKGIRRQVTAEIKDTFSGTDFERKEKINKETDKKVSKHLKQLEKFLD